MKTYSLVSILMLFPFVFFGQINTPSGASIPFGSNTKYEFGTLPSNLPTSGSYGQSSTVATEYLEWRSNLATSCGDGTWRIKFDNSAQTVSEGIGYGLLLAAYAGDQELFDGLWAYYQKHSNTNGMMNWKVNGCSGIIGENGASDADVDATMALVVAATQWPSDASYVSDALTMISRIKAHEINLTNYTLENGDVWKPSCRNPSYQPPAYFRVWKEFVAQNGSADDTFWDNCIQGTENLIITNAHASTGLPSNWSNPDGTLNSSCSGSGTSSTGFGYDAIRAPWRCATDVLWYGESSIQAVLNKQADFWINEGGASVVSGERGQDGSGTGDHNGTFVGMCGAASLGATNTASRQSFVNDMYTENLLIEAAYNPGYFNNTLRMIGLFVQTGNFWNPMSNQCSKPDLGDDVSICGVSSLTLDSKLNANGKSFTWKDGNGMTLTGNGPTIEVSSSGTYTVIMDSADCSQQDEIEVLGVLPSVDLGSDQDLCDPSSVTLEAGVSGNGISYNWTRNNESVGTTNSLLVNQAGVYKLEISATGCPSQSDEVTFTSSLPEVVNDTICAAGNATFSVIGNGSYTWYDNNDTEIGTGNSIVKPISQNTTYYVADESSFSGSVGQSTAIAGNGTNWGHNTDNRMVFTPNEDFSITSLKVKYYGTHNEVSNGVLKLKLYDSNGTLIKDVTSDESFVPKYNNTVGLVEFFFSDFTIEKAYGSDLQLGFNGSTENYGNPVWDASGATYPYDSDPSGVVSITGVSAQSASAYHYFYDWKISAGVSCAKAAVIGVIDATNPSCSEPSCNAPTAINFTENSVTVCEDNSDVTVGGTIVGSAVNGWFATISVDNNPVATDVPLVGSTFSYPVSGLTNGVYNVTVSIEDGNNGDAGCTLSNDMTITVDSKPTANITTTDLSYCEGETGVTLSAENVTGASYLWSNGGTTRTITNATAGDYTVEVTKNSCVSVSSEVTVSEITSGSVAVESVSTEFCEGESLTLTSSVTGTSYLWSNGSTTKSIDVTVGGDYSVEVTNNGCTVMSNEVTITSNALPTANITTTDLSYCEGETGVTLSAENVAGASYLWSNGATTRTITNVTAGDYTVEVTKSSCTSTSNEVTVSEITSGSVAVESVSTEFCEGESLTLTSSVTGTSYLWSNGSMTKSIDVTVGGDYSVEVTNSGCAVMSNEVTVTENVLPEALITSTGLDYCEGGNGVSLSAKAVTGATYVWSNNSTGATITGVTAGDYTVTVSKDGCSAVSSSATVLENELPVSNITTTDLSYCEGGNGVTLSAENVAGADYLWSNGATTRVISNALAGDYSVEVMVNNCSATSSDVTVSETANAPVEVQTLKSEICSGESTTLIPSINGTSYLWSTGETSYSIAVDQAGAYSVRVSNNSCESVSDDIIISNGQAPNASIISTELDYCSGGNGVNLEAENVAGASYLWSNGATTRTISNVLSGDYSVTVSNGSCSATSSEVKVTEVSLGAVDIISTNLTYCEGESGVTLEAAEISGATYTWSNGASGRVITDVKQGDYSVTVSTNNCNGSSQPVSVIEEVKPSASIITSGANLEYCEGENGVNLVANNISGATYTWSNGLRGRSINGVIAGDYTVEVELNGCKSTSASETVVALASPALPVISGVDSLCSFDTPSSSYSVADGAVYYDWTSSVNIINGIGTSSVELSFAPLDQTYADLSVVAYGDNGCVSEQADFTVVLKCNPLSSGEGFVGADYSVFPNPFNHNLQIVTSSYEDIEVIELFGNDGSLLISTTSVDDINNLELLNGVYLLKVKTSQGIHVDKIEKIE